MTSSQVHLRISPPVPWLHPHECRPNAQTKLRWWEIGPSGQYGYFIEASTTADECRMEVRQCRYLPT